MFLRLLLWLYIPFLLGLGALMGWLGYLLVQATITHTCVIAAAAPLILLLAVTLLQLLWALSCVLTRLPDPVEIHVRLPSKLLEPIYGFVADIAQKQQLLRPHEIRIGAETVAHVYEDGAG